MKTIAISITAICSISSVVLASEQAVTNRAAGTSAVEHVLMKRHGGSIWKPNSGKGRVVIFNNQSRVSNKDIERTVSEIKRKLLVDAIVTSNASSAQLKIEVVDNKTDKALTVFPDDGVALVNVGALDSDSPEQSLLATRTRKDILRALIHIGGYASSAGCVGTLSGPIRNLPELDTALECLPADMDVRNEAFLAEVGIKPYLKTTYKRACEEGWAPEPANEYQRKIWNQIHEKPTEPIKITFDPKSDTK